MPSDDQWTRFEPDRPTEWSESDFARFVEQRDWILARTMPQDPHAYTLRRGVPRSIFDEAVRFIREHGEIEIYGGKRYKTLHFRAYKYWTMGSPLAKTILINRKSLAVSQHPPPKPVPANSPHLTTAISTRRSPMATQPLLAHLAPRFVTQRENLATEALAYILSRSQAARAALIRSMRLLGIQDLPDDLLFRTQAVGSDGIIPDLVGEDSGRVQRLMIEAKFWAGLTEAQPVGYLRRIENQGQGDLVFLTPERRTDLVWQELGRRCAEAGIELEQSCGNSAGTRLATVSSGRSLGIISWTSLLTALLADVEAAGEQIVAADLRQLQGLCEREDAEAFLPLTSEELTGNVGQRIIQFSDLVDELTGMLVDRGRADVKGLRASGSKGFYGKYLRIEGVPSFLHFNAGNWGALDTSPLWLRVMGPGWKADTRIGEHLRNRAAAERFPVYMQSEGAEIPIVLRTNVERDRVVDSALAQLIVIADWLKELAVENSGTDEPPAEDDGLVAGSSTDADESVHV